jgi:zinc transporter 5/7
LEALERLWQPKEIEQGRLLQVAFAGLAVNLVGIFAFDHGHHHHHHHHHPSQNGHQGCSFHHHDDDHSHSRNALLDGMFLHILADTLGSVGVIVSTLLIQYFGWLYADPLCSLFIAGLIIMSTWPMFKETAMALMQRVPEHHVQKLGRLTEGV